MTPHQNDVHGHDTLDRCGCRLLPILRHLLQDLTLGERGAAFRGYATAAELWGEGRGLAIAHRAHRFLDALLRSRGKPLDTTDPLGPAARGALTGDEALLMALIDQMRRDQTRGARNTLAVLAFGRVEAGVVQNGLSLASLLGDMPGPSARRPVLRVV